jgi:hypothetical protein
VRVLERREHDGQEQPLRLRPCDRSRLRVLRQPDDQADSDGTNTISKNDIGQTSDNNLLVSVAGGDYTITNHKFHDAQFNDYVYVSHPDTRTFTGNKAQMCYRSAFYADVDTNPVVNGNTGIDASGITGASTPTMYIVCDGTCDGGQVNNNLLDGGGNEQQGLIVTNNSLGDGLTISGNTITNMQGTGLEIGGDGNATVSNNVVANSSDVDDPVRDLPEQQRQHADGLVRLWRL